MDPRMKKNSSSMSGSDIPSPVLLRRRLSAPETVMRKYKLARARSQDSDTDPSTDSKFGELSYNSHSGSEINLQKKKDTAVMMRKSTLLRRLMNNPKTFGSSSFQEWQHYCGKLSTPSLNSLQGSPEHMSKSYSRRSLIGYEYKTSPKHAIGSKKVSPVHQLYESHKKSPVHLVSMSPKRRIENHNYHQVHCTKPKENPNLSSHRSSINDHSFTKNIFSGHSDSAYSNDRSNFSPISMSTCSSNNTNLTAQGSIIYRNGTLENNPENMDQRNVDENRNFSVDTMNFVTQETSTQTSSTTNLNVISNVKLSQKTLDLIVSEVMKDVQKCSNGNDVQEKTGGSIQVRKISGINVKPSRTIEPPNETFKYLTDTRLETGGHNSSRVSGISSKSSIGDRSDNIEDHSDLVSLADSLEETSSSRLSFKRYDDKPVRGDLPPIPIRDRRKLIDTKPPDAFFVPIKTDTKGVKSVSDYLPEKLKKKILRRQKNRQDKFSQDKDGLDFLKMAENAKESCKTESKSKHLRNKARFRKPLLPSIESFRKSQKDGKNLDQEEKANPKKSRKKSKDIPQTSRKPKSTGHHQNERHFHLYTSENNYIYDGVPQRIYHKAEFRNSNRRIEILEIMECVDLGERTNKITTKTKSKIPVLRNHKLTKSGINPFLMKKATYLDFGAVFKADPNLDKLITDILIQSLNNNNKEVPTNEKTSNSTNETKEEVHQEESTVIPEEITEILANENDEMATSPIKSTNESAVQVSENEFSENSPVTNKVPEAEKIIFDANHNEGPVTRDTKDTQTRTDDWAGFYPPQKKEQPSDQTSSEGRKPLTPKIEMKNRKLDESEEFKFSSEEWRRYRTMQDYEFDRNGADRQNDVHKKIILPPPISRRYAQSSRRPRYRNATDGNPTPGEWSVILSGSNNASLASDLEMKIRFPSSHRTRCFPFNSDSESRESRENTEFYNGGRRFSSSNHKHFNKFENGNSFYNENNGRFRKLPGINSSRDTDNRRISDPVAALRAMDISDIRPRQTKTSLRRYNMSRPKLHPLFESTVDNSNIESEYAGVLNRVPDLLSINGYSVSPDNNRYHVPGMGRNITRHSCISNGI